MGERGPAPKRSEERIRRNADVIDIDRPLMSGQVVAPELGIEDPHPMIADFYESLKESGQAKYYEPSDWQFARWTMHWMNDLIKSSKPSSVMLQTVNNALSDLLVTEAERRRVRMEVEREAAKEAAVLDVAEMFRQRMANG